MGDAEINSLALSAFIFYSVVGGAIILLYLNPAWGCHWLGENTTDILTKITAFTLGLSIVGIGLSVLTFGSKNIKEKRSGFMEIKLKKSGLDKIKRETGVKKTKLNLIYKGTESMTALELVFQGNKRVKLEQGVHFKVIQNK